uniref:Uncharacterized protein n=1 Tax=Siphoviridae sp. ctylc9 TaxID=2827977 RepID=A0A8S5S929_9CAUD|nr:MAG TPA: hypothetical protein [Siphoviridae sp. ctylc9]DAY02449.1 MAG TPA: hypothetical protein [Caudoviricetes sp.]
MDYCLVLPFFTPFAPAIAHKAPAIALVFCCSLMPAISKKA